MNENAYRARAERGEVQIGTWVTMIRTPAVLTLLQAAGLDFVRVDMEHSAFSMETVADMATLARALDFPMVVRPPEGNREWVTRLLDAGVWNLHIPQVDTPEQAAAVAACSRYAPLGERGMYGFGPHTQYRTSPPGEHMSSANTRDLVHPLEGLLRLEHGRDRRGAGHRRADHRPDRPGPGPGRAGYARPEGRAARLSRPPGRGRAQARQGRFHGHRQRGGRA